MRALSFTAIVSKLLLYIGSCESSDELREGTWHAVFHRQQQSSREKIIILTQIWKHECTAVVHHKNEIAYSKSSFCVMDTAVSPLISVETVQFTESSENRCRERWQF